MAEYIDVMGGDCHVKVVPHLQVAVVEMESFTFTLVWRDWRQTTKQRAFGDLRGQKKNMDDVMELGILNIDHEKHWRRDLP